MRSRTRKTTTNADPVKGGAIPGEFHSAGIIFAERPAALAIYSKGTAEITSKIR